VHNKFIPKKDLAKKFGLDTSKPIVLLAQHPVIFENKESTKHMREILSAITELAYQTILIYPNADAGGRSMIDVIEQYSYSFLKKYKSLPRTEFLSLMKIADVMVGNSCSGIEEAPSFHLPVVNIGTRQKGRMRAENVIDVGYDREEIKKAIEKALFDERFKARVKKCKNQYGDGKSGERIARILANLKISDELLQKKITY
jgi:UDP-hydrolysing UDP-N-acetyl-D-glucosamine 2-epimerase